MRNIWILFKRELMAYFLSPIAYIVGVSVLVLMGVSFCMLANNMNGSPNDHSLSMWFFNGFFTWITLLLISPVITMRLFAEDKKTGIIESIMTTPLRDREYVLAKFLGGYFFFLLLWLPTASYIFILRHFTQDQTPLDVGPIIGGYIGLGLLGMLFISLGCMASACTRNQIVAAVIAFVLGTLVFFLGFLSYMKIPSKYQNIADSVSMFVHMNEMSSGFIGWQRIVFYLSSTSFFLFVTHRIVQAHRWKS